MFYTNLFMLIKVPRRLPVLDIVIVFRLIVNILIECNINYADFA